MSRPPASRDAALKLAFLVVTAAGVSAAILAARAQRLAASHAAAAALDEARELERAIDRARLDVARLSSPDRVQLLIDARRAEDPGAFFPLVDPLEPTPAPGPRASAR